MCTRLLLIVFVFIVPVSVLPSLQAVAQTVQTESQGPTKPEASIEVAVQNLVKDLSHPSASRRTEAEKELLALGPSILLFLPEKARTSEGRMRLNRIRLTLERLEAESSLQAGRFSLPEGVKTEEIPRIITEQTRNPFFFKMPEGASVPAGKSLDFWDFLDELCDQYHLEPQFTSENGTEAGLKLVPSVQNRVRGAKKNPGVVYLKPFRLEAVKVARTRASAKLLQLELAWEPRITPVFAYLTIQEGNFDGGETVKFPSMEYEILIRQKDFHAFCDVPLSGKHIPPEAHSMTIRGVLSAVVCGVKKDFMFDELDKKLDHEFQAVSERTASVLVTFSRLRTEKSKGKIFLAATLRYRYEEAHEAMESHRTWIYENDAVLIAPDGRKIPSEYSELLRQTPNEIAVEIFFPADEAILKDLSGWKLVFPRPGGIYEEEMPFELKAIPLP